MLWLLVLVPVVLVAAKLTPTAHTLLFVLSVLAIVPLAALLSHATESVAEKTGDGRRVTQRDVGKPYGTGHCSGGAPCRRVCAGQRLYSRRYCDQHSFYARGIILSRRAQTPHPGVQSRYRPSRCGFALPRHDCTRESFGDRQSRPGAGRRLDPEAQRRFGRAADRRIRIGVAVFT